MKKVRYLFTSVAILFSINSFSQHCKTIIDTFYIITVDYFTKGYSPQRGMIVIKRLENLHCNKYDNNKFICDLYTNGNYLVPPPFDYVENLRSCFSDSSTIIYNNEYAEYIENLKFLDKKSLSHYFLIENKIKTRIKVSKAICEFWFFRATISDINRCSDHIEVKRECLNSIGYSLKCIKHVFTLSRMEKRIIKLICQ